MDVYIKIFLSLYNYMGIKKLFTFLNNNHFFKIYPFLNNLIDELDIDKKKLLIGIDGNLFCYKYSHSYDNMLIGFFNQILKFLSNKIIPFYIFDGGTIQEKEQTNMIRLQKKNINKDKLDKIENIINENENENNFDLFILKKKLEKNSIKINFNSINLLLELLDLLNIPYIFSHGEGEYLAVLLNQYKIIDMFLTDDTDPIPAGINKIIKFYNNNVYFLDTTNLFKDLNLSTEQFCDFCILLGSDYASFNHGLKVNEILDLIHKYKSIENIINNIEIDNLVINNLNSESLPIISNIRNIYKFSPENEKNMFINLHNMNNIKYNFIIDHNNFNYYSNIILEYWDDFINILKTNNNDYDNITINSNLFKTKINDCVRNHKFNIKNIVKFIKNNIKDITNNEINNIIVSFEFLNKFGI